jgi:hypothetical protein
MICPKCGFEQPDQPECARCGVIVSRYKGPVLGTAMPSLSPPPEPMAAIPVLGTVYGDPVPAAAGGGTIYGGPPMSPPAGSVSAAPAFGVSRSTFGVGEVLGQTFSIYFANFLPFVVLTAIALSPLFVVEGYGVAAKTIPGSAASLIPLLLVLVAAAVCPYLATGAITYGVFQQMRGKDTSIGDCLSRGLSSLLLILGLSIWQGLLIGLGLIACVVPGIMMAVRWAVSLPAAVTERVGISESMSRSTYLTEGQRWDVFRVLFVLGVLNGGTTLLVTLATATNPMLHLLLSGVANLLVVGLSATGSAVMYYRLRDLKESIDVDQVASVFA